MKHIVIGTAGHVDHGKTMLVKALTGTDTDRLKEEKERGISIELGFAPLTLPNGQQAAIIDVPGHEKFIKQMLAGVASIDLVLLVIAADEGVMPQTKEHLDIIKLLQIERGIVVITKRDLVDDDWLELISEEIKEVLIDTPLSTAPIISVSTISGQGIEELLDLIQAMVVNLQEVEVYGKSKMSIDRVFSITGFGTVVTGTLTSGKFRVGEVLEILPEGLQVKVRTLQVHGKKVEEAQVGQRVAVNLAGVEVQEVARGSVLVEVNALRPSFRLDCQLELLTDADKELANRARVRIHLGTKELLGRILLLDREKIKPGEKAFVQIQLEEEAVADKKDKFVIRAYSPMVTIGGGIVVDPNPGKHKRYSEKVLEALKTKLKGTPDELVLQFLGQKKDMLLGQELSDGLGLSSEDLVTVINTLTSKELVKVVNIDGKDRYLLMQYYKNWIDNTSAILQDFHIRHPLRIGFNKEEIRSRLFSSFNNKQFSAVLEAMYEDHVVKIIDNVIALFHFEPKPTNEEARVLGFIEGEFQRSTYQPPAWEEILANLKISPRESEEYLQFLLDKNILVKVGDLLFHQKVVKEAETKIVEYLKEKGDISLAESRDLFETSRKFMLPLLEYFDRIKVTRRVEDKRVLYRVR